MKSLVIGAAIALTGCGGATVTEGPAVPSPSEGKASTLAPGSAMVVTRSGGIAGFQDVVEIDADGSAQVTTRDGATRGCTPDATAVDRLRAFDLAAVGSGSSTIADGFTYEVRSDSGTASAGDGDKSSVRVAFAGAAAAVVSSCLASASGLATAPER